MRNHPVRGDGSGSGQVQSRLVWHQIGGKENAKKLHAAGLARTSALEPSAVCRGLVIATSIPEENSHGVDQRACRYRKGWP